MIFESLAAHDDGVLVARKRAIMAARVRIDENYGRFLKNATNAVERRVRLASLEDELKQIVRDVVHEYDTELGPVVAAMQEFVRVACDEDCDEDCPDCHGKHKKHANKYIKQQGGKWVITQKGTGKVLSEHDSEEKAQESFDAMEAHKHGALPAPMGDPRNGPTGPTDPGDFAGQQPTGDPCPYCSGPVNPQGQCMNCSRMAVAKVAADAETGDSSQLERVKLPSNKDNSLGGPSPKIDKGKSGDQTGWSTKPIDVGSKRHPHERQDLLERADYNSEDFDPSSPVRERVDADKAMQSEHNVAPHTDTWSGTSGLAAPVTNAVLAKYQIVELE